MTDDIENTPAARHVLRAHTEREAARRAADLLTVHRDPHLVTRTLHRWVLVRHLRHRRRTIPRQRSLP